MAGSLGSKVLAFSNKVLPQVKEHREAVLQLMEQYLKGMHYDSVFSPKMGVAMINVNFVVLMLKMSDTYL